jgi:hypothetical protein
MSAKVLSLHTRGNQIACIWHPEAVGEVLETPSLGNIRVRIGEPHFQLTSGDVVFL